MRIWTILAFVAALAIGMPEAEAQLSPGGGGGGGGCATFGCLTGNPTSAQITGGLGYTPVGTGGPGIAIRTVTSGSSTNVTGSDFLVKIDKTSGSATSVTVPACSSANLGQTFQVKDGKGDANTNNITISPASGTIDGASNYIESQPRQSITITCDGISDWTIT